MRDIEFPLKITSATSAAASPNRFSLVLLDCALTPAGREGLPTWPPAPAASRDMWRRSSVWKARAVALDINAAMLAVGRASRAGRAAHRMAGRRRGEPGLAGSGLRSGPLPAGHAVLR